MAYIGQSPSIGEFRKLDDISGLFNDSNTTFALTVNSSSVVPGSEQALLISIDGVLQEPGTAYYLSGTDIVFTAAPNTSSTFFGVQLGSVGQIGVPTDGTITTGKLAANAVTLAKIATNAVDTGQLVNDAVTSAKILNGAVTGDKLDTDAVTTAKILNGAVTGDKLDTDAVTTSKILNDAVTTSKILNGAVTSDKLNTISNVNITGGNITNANIYDVGLRVSQISSSSNAITLNYETATVFVCNATENANITLTNFPESGVALLKLTYGGNYTIGYAGNAKFATSTAPTLTAAGLDHLYFEGNVNGYLVTSVLDIQGA